MTTADASGTQQGSQTGATATQTTQQTQAIEYKFDPIEGISLSPEFDTDVASVAKEMGWDLDTAKKFRAYEAKQAHAALEADKAAQAEVDAKREQEINQQKQAWEKANRDDPDYGGQKYDETTQRIDQLFAASGERGKALMAKMGENAKTLLATPEFRGFLAWIAYQTADAKVRQGGEVPGKKSDAELFYGAKS